MTPPICRLCKKDFYFAADYGYGRLVIFKNYKDLPEGMVGKPQGCDWYCDQHYQSALAKNYLTNEDAYLELKKEFPNVKIHDWQIRYDPEIWITDIGVYKAKIVMYIRQIRQITPFELKQKLSQKEFKVAHGWPTSIMPHKRKLEALGATVEVRFR